MKDVTPAERTASSGAHNLVPDAQYIRRELPIADVAHALGLEPCGRRLRCPTDRSHWAGMWLRKNSVKCFTCWSRPLSTIDLVMVSLGMDVGAALAWLAQHFDIPKRRVRVTTNRHGLTRHRYVDYRTVPRPKRLEPSVASLRRAPGWPELSHAARLLAPVLLEIIPKESLTITTTQECLRHLAGIANRRTAKNALRQLEGIGLIATGREAVGRESRSGRFTTALSVRLAWASPTFQGWLNDTATKLRCSLLNTVKRANRHEIEHGKPPRAVNFAEQAKPTKQNYGLADGADGEDKKERYEAERMIQVSEVPRANPKLIYNAGDEWKALGLSPVGETTFRAYWRALFQRQKGSPVGAVVAQMYEAARRFGIPIPDEFTAAARKVGQA